MSSSKPGNDPTTRALAAAARYVRSGARSTSEVIRYLQRRGLPPATAARVVSDYRTRGLLDDRVCARLWAGHWARRGYAWAAIRVKLSAKGLAEEAIAAAAGEWDAPEDDMARARQIMAAHPASRGGAHARVRAARALSARGFDADLIERLLNESFSPSVSDAER